MVAVATVAEMAPPMKVVQSEGPGANRSRTVALAPDAPIATASPSPAAEKVRPREGTARATQAAGHCVVPMRCHDPITFFIACTPIHVALQMVQCRLECACRENGSHPTAQ